MSNAVGVRWSASAADWTWSAFWLACPFLAITLVLAIATVIALLRARREDVPTVFSVFGTSLTQLARRLPRQDANSDLDSGTDGRDAKGRALAQDTERA